MTTDGDNHVAVHVVFVHIKLRFRIHPLVCHRIQVCQSCFNATEFELVQVYHWQYGHLDQGPSRLCLHLGGPPLLQYLQEGVELLVLHISKVQKRVSGWDPE